MIETPAVGDRQNEVRARPCNSKHLSQWLGRRIHPRKYPNREDQVKKAVRERQAMNVGKAGAHSPRDRILRHRLAGLLDHGGNTVDCLNEVASLGEGHGRHSRSAPNFQDPGVGREMQLIDHREDGSFTLLINRGPKLVASVDFPPMGGSFLEMCVHLLLSAGSAQAWNRGVLHRYIPIHP